MPWRAWSIALLAAALAVASLHLIGWPQRQLSVDVHSAYHPKQEAAAAAYRAGRLPLWNPYEFNGIPLLAAASASVLYPPVVATSLLVPQPWAEEILAAGHVALFCVGFALVVAAAGGSPLAAAVGALLALSGALAGVTLQSPHKLASLAWFPLLLHLARRASDDGAPARIGALGLAFGMQLLAGYPDYAIDSAVLLGAVELGEAQRPLLRRLVRLGMGLALGGCIAAVQLLPLNELVRESDRGAPGSNLAAILPGSLWLSSIKYSAVDVIVRFGWAFPLLFLGGMSLSRRPERGWALALFWATFALWFPFSLLYLFPPWSSSRAPIGWLALGPVLAGLLAASGIDRALRSRRRWLAPVAFGLALLGLWHGERRIRTFDGVIEIHQASPPLLRQRASALRELQARLGGDAAVLSWSEAWNGSFLRYGLRSPAGSEPSKLAPRRITRLLAAIGVPQSPVPPQSWHRFDDNADLAALLGVGLVVGLPPWLDGLPAAGFTAVGQIDAERVLYRTPLPRVRLVHRGVTVPSEDAEVAQVVKHAREAATSAVLDATRPAPELVVPPADAVESAAIVKDEPERVEIEAQVASPALLVLRDSFFPGWRASVDGEPIEIARADYAFRGVALGAGRHRVVFEYAPAPARTGLVASALGVALSLCLIAFGRRGSR